MRDPRSRMVYGNIQCCASALVSKRVRIRRFRSMRIRILFRIPIQGFEGKKITFFYLKKCNLFISMEDSYRKSLQPSKENNNLNLFLFLQVGFLRNFFCVFYSTLLNLPPSDSTVSEDAGIEPRTVVTYGIDSQTRSRLG